jgi:hypothetical protein
VGTIYASAYGLFHCDHLNLSDTSGWPLSVLRIESRTEGLGGFTIEKGRSSTELVFVRGSFTNCGFLEVVYILFGSVNSVIAIQACMTQSHIIIWKNLLI